MPYRHLTGALLAIAMALPLAATADDDDGNAFGAAGVLSSKNRGEIPEILLSAGTPLLESGDSITLRSGTYYELDITADGSQELALFGADFFRAIWIDEIVIEGLEIRPLGLDSVEFDEAGTMEIGFVAIKPGSYYMKIPGSTGETQRVEIVIK